MSGNVLSCGIVLARKTDDGWLTLLLRAYHHWDFPKGLQEDGEQPKEAAIREVGEETSIDELDFAWGDRFMETGPYSRGKTARYYLAKTSQASVVMGPSPETGEPERTPINKTEPLRRIWKSEYTLLGRLGKLLGRLFGLPSAAPGGLAGRVLPAAREDGTT